MATPEKLVEDYLIAEIKRIGGYAYKFVSPARRSVPDRLCVLPFGLVIFVECKGPDGKLSKGQEREFDRLTNMSQLVFVVSSKAEINELIKACVTIMRQRSSAKQEKTDD